MKDVARRAHVSTATVSRTLRYPERVSQRTRHRVQQSIKVLGYVNNLVAGSLVTNRTKIIAALVPTFDNRDYSKTIHAMAEVLHSAGYHLLLGHHGFSLEREESLIAAFLGRRPDGFFLHGRRHTPSAIRLLQNASIPVVESGDLEGRPIDMVVSYSNFEAARELTSHLVQKGYRRIALVCAPWRESERHARRWRGYRAALQAHGMVYSARRFVQTAALGMDHGAEALTTLLDRDPRIDAVFFTSDVMAVGALLECQRRGWKIPDRVAIAGFDDQDIASRTVPPLTTVRLPRYEIGRLAGQMILDRLTGRNVRPKVVNAGFQIMDRKSA
jgi:LacI family gluconate utilization system Gnt-I transcriptional repressor